MKFDVDEWMRNMPTLDRHITLYEDDTELVPCLRINKFSDGTFSVTVNDGQDCATFIVEPLQVNAITAFLESD